jgi:plasmid stabilization system protein ParE
MKLVFDDAALADLDHVYKWIARDSRRAAKNVVDRIFASIENLALFPLVGRSGRDEGTREWVVPRLPYIVVYEVDAMREGVLVIAIFHQAQDRDAILKERR